MTKRTLTVTTPNGTLDRTTARTYTHVVVGKRTTQEIRDDSGEWVSREIPEADRVFVAIGWCGSRELAEKLARTWAAKRYYHGAAIFADVTILPVNGAA